MNIVQRLWRGEVPLGRAFWGFMIGGGLLLNAATTLAALSQLGEGRSILPFLAIYALPLPFNIFMMIAVWRSAARYQGPRQFADLARLGAAAWTVLASVL